MEQLQAEVCARLHRHQTCVPHTSGTRHTCKIHPLGPLLAFLLLELALLTQEQGEGSA